MSTADWSSTLEVFGLAIAAAAVAGAVVPLIGSFLLVRRTSFHGIVLPQLAAAGVACSFVVLPYWNDWIGLGDPLGTLDYRLAFAALFTFGGLVVLSLGGGQRGEVGRLAALFAVAAAATVLLAHLSPAGEILITSLMKGEILFVGPSELTALALGLGVVLAAVLWLRRDFTLISFDPDEALVLGRPLRRLEAALQGLTGLTVTAGVLTVGPVVLFGLLILPPLAARAWARSMGQLLGLSSALGVLASLAGTWASFRFDTPLGPCLVLAAGATLVPAAFAPPRR